MERLTQSDNLQGAEFVDADLRGARFVRADLSGVVMRGVEVAGAEIDSPWLFEGDSLLRVNGVDVIGFVEAELNRRFPGRGDRRAADPEGLRAAWAALERTWAGTLERVAAMPVGTVEVSVDGEWSFAQTLRHLVLATDMWLGRAILEADQPFHPLGLADTGAGDGSLDMSDFTTVTPSYDDVLEARASRVAMVCDFIATVTPDDLAAPRRNPHDPGHAETTLSCLHTPRGGVGAPPLRRTRPRGDRGEVRRMSKTGRSAVLDLQAVWGDQYPRAMHTGPRHGRGSLADLTRAGAILLGAVLMGMVALVVGPTRVNWSGTRLVFILLMGVSALLTIRFMPIRLPGEPRSQGDGTAPDGAHSPRTAVVAAAALAGGAAAPLLAGVGAFFFLLAVFAGWLFGVGVKVILKSRGR